MGGKSSQSSSDVDKSTRVTTTTTTDVGDIGLTGANARDIVALLEDGATMRADSFAKVIEPVLQATGGGFQQLVGGASDLVKTSNAIAKKEAGLSPGILDGIDLSKLAVIAVAGVGAVLALRSLK